MSDFGAPIAVPAISRCAHGVSSTKRCRNCAAVIEPPLRVPVFFMSANCESICLSYSGPSGMRQTFSPVSAPILLKRSASSSLLENRPACSVPRATMIAPVRVARSIMNLGLNFFATYQSTSARTSRPSASVLMISMVCPDIDVTMSPGRCALPSGMFSTRPIAPTALTLALRAASACIRPTTQAAPAMSPFMSSMDAAGLIEIPPVSKQTPLPMKATGSPLAPFQRLTTTRGLLGRPRPRRKIKQDRGLRRARGNLAHGDAAELHEVPRLGLLADPDDPQPRHFQPRRHDDVERRSALAAESLGGGRAGDEIAGRREGFPRCRAEVKTFIGEHDQNALGRRRDCGEPEFRGVGHMAGSSIVAVLK